MIEKTIFQKIKEVGSHTIIYGIGSVLQSALGFLMIPLYTRKFTPEMYGIFSLITVCGTLAGVVFSFGASSALARSYYDYDDLEERRKVVSTSFYINLAGAIIQCLLGFALGRYISVWLFKTPDYQLHVALAVVASALTFINTFFYMLLRFERLSVQVVIINLVSVTLSLLLIVWFLIGLKMGVMAPILGGVLTQSVVSVVLFVLVRRDIVLGYSANELKLQLPFGAQAVIIGMAYYSFDWLNRYFLNTYGTLSDVGIYSLGYQIGMVINILLIFPFGQIWAPMRMQYRNDENAEVFYRKILSYYFLFGIVLTALISVFSREVITVVAGKKEYVDSCRVVPFVMFGMMMYGAVNIIDNGIYFSRKVIYHAYIFWFTSVVSCVLNFLIVPKFGYVGAAAVILICYCTVLGLVFVVSNRLYRIPFEGKRLAILFTLGITTIVMGNLFVFSTVAMTVVFKLILLFTMFSTIYCFVLTLEEKKKIFQMIGGLRRATTQAYES